MKIHIKVDPERLTLDDLEMIEEGLEKAKVKALKGFISRFLADEAGNFLKDDLAFSEAGKLNLGQLKEVCQAIAAETEKIKKEAVPPPMPGSSSSSPREGPAPGGSPPSSTPGTGDASLGSLPGEAS
jgi:hypothetical protein